MTGTNEIQVVKKHITQAEAWLANVRADLAYAHAVECEHMLESSTNDLRRAETHLKNWQRAFELLTGEPYDAD
jgi:hypothetical protein